MISVLSASTLPLLVLGILGADHAHHAVAADDLAILTKPFY
jgi:hypothetical protein